MNRSVLQLSFYTTDDFPPALQPVNASLLNQTQEQADCEGAAGSDELLVRYYLVAIGGSCICMIGIALNLMLLYLFIHRIGLHAAGNIYLTVLCCLDLLVELSYLFVFPLGLYGQYHGLVALTAAWSKNLPYVYTTAQVSMTAATYVILAAACDRMCTYLASKINRPLMCRKNRVHRTKQSAAMTNRAAMTRKIRFVIVALFCALLLKGSVYWELQVHRNSMCADTTQEWVVGQSKLMAAPDDPNGTNYYKVIWSFYVRQFGTGIFPFTVLIYIEIFLWVSNRVTGVRSLVLIARKQRAERMISNANKAAVRMIVAVVVSYLVCHAFNVVISVWEFIDETSLRHALHGAFYTYSSDIISMLTVANGASRLPLYCFINATIREHLVNVLYRRQKATDTQLPTKEDDTDNVVNMYAALVTAKIDTNGTADPSAPPRISKLSVSMSGSQHGRLCRMSIDDKQAIISQVLHQPNDNVLHTAGACRHQHTALYSHYTAHPHTPASRTRTTSSSALHTSCHNQHNGFELRIAHI